MSYQHTLIASSGSYRPKWGGHVHIYEYRVWITTEHQIEINRIEQELLKAFLRTYSTYPTIEENYLKTQYTTNKKVYAGEVKSIKSRRKGYIENLEVIRYYSKDYSLGYMKARKAAALDGFHFIRKQTYYRLKRGEHKNITVKWVKGELDKPMSINYDTLARSRFYEYRDGRLYRTYPKEPDGSII